ncbi:MAG: L-asparaginase, type I [Clostridiales bacterium 38_11]|nr:MAG: L-asparaginase, type I [Clostridiales bacterium 38_11]HBH12350.1 L-asparaginase 1 [Clostridiales bacterium]
MKKLLLISTGGTIASTVTKEGLAPGISPEEMLKYLNDVGKSYLIDTHELINIDSTNIQPEHWIEISSFIEKKYNEYDGFIITHGTDTMAYTSAALSYLIQNVNKPIIITGSQKPINVDTTDARKNLKDAITYALCDDVSGVYIVFDGKAILGTRARKTKTKSFDAFESINYPVAAFIDGQRVARYVNQEKTTKMPVFYNALYPSIFLLKLAPGMQPDVLDYIGEKYEGIVIESYGAGGLPFEDRRNFLQKMESLTSGGKIIVIASQVMSEGSDMALYEVGIKTLKKYNVIESLDMTLESVLTKLMWIMGQTKEYDKVKELFYTRISNDIMFYS